MRAQSIIAALGFTMAAAAFGQSDSYDISKYQEQLRQNPRSSRAHYELAEIYFHQNNYEIAANEYRQALNGDLEPQLIETLAHLGLAKCFDMTGQPDRAGNERRQASRSSSTPPPPPKTPPAISWPTAIQTAAADYSDEARAAGLEGTVFVSVNVAPDGTPANARVSSPLGLGLDEKAIAAANQWRFTSAGSAPVSVPIHFLLPSKLSRWHLVGASFDPPEHATRPIFLPEPYPLGPGISDHAIDEGWVISSIPRAATVTLRFEVNELGAPTKFQVLAASAELWGNEAIALVRPWRFTPGEKDGKPIPVPCTLDLVWGQKVWTPEILASALGSIHMAASERNLAAPIPTPVSPVLPAEPKIASAYLIEDSQKPHTPLSVILSTTIGEDGIPENIQVVRSLTDPYNSAAIDALHSWRLAPVRLNGQIAPIATLIEVDFVLDQ